MGGLIVRKRKELYSETLIEKRCGVQGLALSTHSKKVFGLNAPAGFPCLGCAPLPAQCKWALDPEPHDPVKDKQL